MNLRKILGLIKRNTIFYLKISATSAFCGWLSFYKSAFYLPKGYIKNARVDSGKKKPLKNSGFDTYTQNVSYKSTDKRMKMKFVHLHLY
jgi:hypothetical protein